VTGEHKTRREFFYPWRRWGEVPCKVHTGRRLKRMNALGLWVTIEREGCANISDEEKEERIWKTDLLIE
jgi:hypothetical protein